MKICVIGNSHAACLYGAWRILSDDHPNISITFYIKGGSYFEHFQVDKKNGHLKMKDELIRRMFNNQSGGDGIINLNDFDSFLIAGCFHRTNASRVAEFGAQTASGFSRQVIESAANDLFYSAHTSILMKKIRMITDKPIYLMHDPFHSPNKADPVGKMVPKSNEGDYRQGISAINEIVLSPIHVELLPQPSETLRPPLLTKFNFAVGKRTVKELELDKRFIGAREDDRIHMNVEFGILRLQKLFDILKVKK